jgi:hypothetical protein
VKNTTAGMVPLCVATVALLTFIDIDWGAVLCAIAAIATLVALVGFEGNLSLEKKWFGVYTHYYLF